MDGGRGRHYQVKDNEILIEGKLNKDEGVVVAMSHNLKWKSEDGQVREDPSGNSKQGFVLRYR